MMTGSDHGQHLHAPLPLPLPSTILTVKNNNLGAAAPNHWISTRARLEAWESSAVAGRGAARRGRAWPPACATPRSARRCTSSPGRARPRTASSSSSCSSSPSTPRTTMGKLRKIYHRNNLQSMAYRGTIIEGNGEEGQDEKDYWREIKGLHWKYL